MDEQAEALRAACTEFVNGDGHIPPAEYLATIPADVVADRYGDGGVVADLERYAADLLGKPAALFLPSGTMAQGATLRVHADHRRSRTVLWHPACHLERHEGQAHVRLHRLVGRSVGSSDALLTTADLEAVAEPVAALVLELPQRDIGGQLPTWDDLCEQVDWARTHGAAAHLDGARLWEATAGYGRPPREIVALFDTVYVSFYKGIGGLPGCCVAGSSELVAELREWRRRLGGTLYGLWPAAASALSLLPERLAEMPARFEHAKAIAAALADVPGVRLVPNPPHTPMMHLLLSVSGEQFALNARRLAEDQGVWTWHEAGTTGDPDVVRCELGVGRATCRLDPERIAKTIAALVSD